MVSVGGSLVRRCVVAILELEHIVVGFAQGCFRRVEGFTGSD